MTELFQDSKNTEPKTRYIEPKISLMWLLSSAAMLLTALTAAAWNLSVANSKMEDVSKSMQRMELRLDSRDERLDRITLDVHTNRSMNEVQNARLGNLEEQVRAIKSFSGLKPLTSFGIGGTPSNGPGPCGFGPPPSCLRWPAFGSP